jgi:tol-pal system protein YbgF
VAVVIAALMALLSGCVAQQADLKQTEKVLQQRIKQSADELAQTRAKQSQEISSLREQELPQLRGELEKALHQAQELQAKQEDLKHRSAQLEAQTKKLEQLAAKLEADSNARYAWVQKSLDNQDARVAARLDEISKTMEAAMAALKKDLAEVVQRTNEGLAKRVDARLDEQQKGLADTQHRLDQVSQKFSQFNQALTGFKEALTALNDRVGQEEQTSKTLAAKIESDAKTASAHALEVNKSIASVAKALESVGQKVTARLDEQDRRIESVGQKVAARFDEQDRWIESVGQKVTARFDEQDRRIDTLAKSVEQASHKAGTRQGATKQAQRALPAPSQEPARPERTEQEVSAVSSSAGEPERAAASTVIVPAPQETQPPEPGEGTEAPDRVQYERVLALFRNGDLDGARQGFTSFLEEYPNSELAPNARYWLGESYYGKKDYRRAIDAYDKVELDYPRSEKVPAALLKKGYAYLALKDKKRASSVFKQVVTLYPKSPEAGKASDKLAQLKEVR